MEEKIVVFWFRRDLRLADNRGLYEALSTGLKVLPIFIFDKNILDKLPSRRDARVQFIHRELSFIRKEMERLGSALLVFHEHPKEAFAGLVSRFPGICAVYANRDFEPYGMARDKEISDMLAGSGIEFLDFTDHVIFGKNEVLKSDGNPYTVFTPYSRRWKAILNHEHCEAYPSEKRLGSLVRLSPQSMPTLQDLGFENFEFSYPPKEVEDPLLRDYGLNRDIPSLRGTSRLGVHLRFGTISVRAMVRKALSLSEVFLNELIWREFFIQVLAHFPHAENGSFKRQYDFIQWRNNENEFRAWCRGETGYPLVDAGMRELLHTGFMHNRVRMITASFLTKHLLIDWRWGEAWFAENLLDYELASNNGNWQWAAGTGCDAAPYFRVFNPETQQEKFDPEGVYVRKWVPEAGTISYARPIVEHKMARERAITTYRNALKPGQ